MPNPTDTFLSGSNIDFIEGLYARWLEDPSSAPVTGGRSRGTVAARATVRRLRPGR